MKSTFLLCRANPAPSEPIVPVVLPTDVPVGERNRLELVAIRVAARLDRNEIESLVEAVERMGQVPREIDGQLLGGAREEIGRDLNPREKKISGSTSPMRAGNECSDVPGDEHSPGTPRHRLKRVGVSDTSRVNMTGNPLPISLERIEAVMIDGAQELNRAKRFLRASAGGRGVGWPRHCRHCDLDWRRARNPDSDASRKPA